jgi:hypothetical protein
MKLFNALKIIRNSEDKLFSFILALTLPFAFLIIAFPGLGFVFYVSDNRFAYLLIGLGITCFFVTARLIYLEYFAKPKINYYGK